MSVFNYVDAVVILHLERRKDRWRHMRDELALMGLTPTSDRVHVHEGYDMIAGSGNRSCTEGHRGILEVAYWHGWSRTLVLEDDFAIRKEFRDDFKGALDMVMEDVPFDADIVYLGGQYADNPKRRHSEHLIEVNRMLTTSSFIISNRMARRMAPHISGEGPIDNLFGDHTQKGNCFCVQPRLFYQYTSKSDLTGREDNYQIAMEDTRHEEMLLEGTLSWHSSKMKAILQGRLQRSEVCAQHDMDGTEVIVDGNLFRITSVDFPDHPPSWFRDEPVTYHLVPVE